MTPASSEPVADTLNARFGRALLQRFDVAALITILLVLSLSIFQIWTRHQRETARLWEQARVETLDAASQQASATVRRGDMLDLAINKMELAIDAKEASTPGAPVALNLFRRGPAQGLPDGQYAELKDGELTLDVLATSDFRMSSEGREFNAAVAQFREFAANRRADPGLIQFIYVSKSGKFLISGQALGERVIPIMRRLRAAGTIEGSRRAIESVLDRYWPIASLDGTKQRDFRWQALYKGDQLQEPLSRMVGPVMRQGSPIGVLAIIYRANDIYPLYDNPPVLGRLLLVGEDGTIAADSTRPTKQIGLPEKLPLDLADGFAAAKKTPGNITRIGDQRFVATPVAAAPNYFILLAAPRDAASNLVLGETARLAIVLMLSIVLMAGLLLYLRRSLVQPAVNLLEGVSDEDSGPLAPRTHPAWLPWAKQIDDSRENAARNLRETEAQGRFTEAVVSTAIDCIVTSDELGVITGFNPAAERVFGWSQEEAIGRRLEETIIPEQHREAHRKGMARMVASGEARVIGRRVELEGLRRDGSVFPVELALAEATIDGERQFIAYLRDLSSQRDAEAERNALRSQLEAFFDNVPASMYLRDPVENRFVMYNRWGATMLGTTPEAVVGSNFDDFRHLIGTDNSIHSDEQIFATGQAVTSERVYHLPSGDRTGMVTHFPVKDSEGKIVLIGGMIFDISDYKRTEEELLASRESLHQSEKLAALGQLLAGVAHELNNPLAIVVGRASMLRDQLTGSTHEASLDKLRAAADRCSRIVKTFLTMARQTGPRRSLVDINELVEGALDMTAYGLRTAGISIEQQLADDLPLTNADGDQIVQVLINLIINAQHAMEARSDNGILTVATRVDVKKHLLMVDVADTGPGVPKDIASRIFDPFFTTKDVGIGTGMGLSVSKGMIETQGGSLELVRNSAKGATFRITLPLDSGDEGKDADLEPVQAGELGGRILIVDDEAEIAEMIAECLQPIGIETTIVADGQAALDALAQMDFDAVLSDVRMPGMDGIALLGEIRRQYPALTSRIAFISGDVLQADRKRSDLIGDCPMIEKPFSPEQIRAVARDLLSSGEHQ